MGRAPCCDKANVKRGPWSPEEDATLINYLQKHGTSGNWISLPRKAGLKRCGKSCRLRWLNYLRPDIKHGGFTEEEDKIILSLYNSMGSRWSFMASQLPGRTDNDVKNYWNTRLKKKLLAVAGKNTNINSSRGSKKSNNTNNIMEKSLISIPEADQSTYTINPENSSSLLPPLTDMGFEQNYYCDIPQELNLEQKNQLIPLSSTFMELPNFSPYGCDNNYITTSTVSSLSSPSSRETLMNNNLRSAAVGDGSSLLLDEDGIFLPDIELLDQSSYYYEQVNVFGNFS